MKLNPLLFRDPFTEDVRGLYFYSLDMLKRNVGKTREDIIIELSRQLGVKCPSNSSEEARSKLWGIRSELLDNGSQSVTSTSDQSSVASLRRRETPPLTPERQSELDQLISEDYFTHGHRAGKCRVCNTPLKDPVSLARGIGPCCIKKIGARGR